MAQKFTDLPGWTFDVDEVSANVYKVVGRDAVGRTFEKSGFDPDQLLEEAKEYARQVLAGAGKKTV